MDNFLSSLHVQITDDHLGTKVKESGLDIYPARPQELTRIDQTKGLQIVRGHWQHLRIVSHVITLNMKKMGRPVIKTTLPLTLSAFANSSESVIVVIT